MKHAEETSPGETAQGLPVVCVHCREHRHTEGVRWVLSSLIPEIRTEMIKGNVSLDKMGKEIMHCILTIRPK